MLRMVLSATNGGDIRSHYIRSMTSTMCGEEHEISQSPNSQFDIESRWTVCASFTVKSASVFSS